MDFFFPNEIAEAYYFPSNCSWHNISSKVGSTSLPFAQSNLNLMLPQVVTVHISSSGTCHTWLQSVKGQTAKVSQLMSVGCEKLWLAPRTKTSLVAITSRHTHAHTQREVDPTLHTGTTEMAAQPEVLAFYFSLAQSQTSLPSRTTPSQARRCCQQVCVLYIATTAKFKLNFGAISQQQQSSVSGPWWMIVCLKRDLPSNAPSPNAWPLD